MTALTRRRFLTIAAASVALPCHADPAHVAHWRGRALGAGASMQLAGMTEVEAAPIFADVEKELARLEGIFSIYQGHSEVSRLNRDGKLFLPSPELLGVLSLCRTLHHATDGVFDPTVQPLWLAIANGAKGPELEQARQAVGMKSLKYDTAKVWFTGENYKAAITLNGIAQGVVTDRIVALLKARGLRDVLVDMGEIAALGASADGADWSVGIADAKGVVVQRVALRDRAIATSAPLATLIGPDRDHSHIISTGKADQPRALISVSAPTAALADGLSTALCLMRPDRARAVLARFPQARLEITKTSRL